METEERIGYRIVQIKTVKIIINEPDDLDFDQITVTGKVNLSTTSLNNEKVEIVFEVVTEFIDKRTNETLISHIGRTKYIAVNIIISEDQEVINIPDQLMIMLYAIAHSHSRALLSSDLQNTIYKDKIFIPVIDPKDILNREMQDE